MAKNNTITLYDLQLASGCTLSPFVWRTKYALKHKGFDLDIVPGGFTGILERTDGHSARVPVIVDDGTWVLDSWKIAEYLDETYPDRPMLFSDVTMKSLTKFLDAWLWRTAIGPWFYCYIQDYHDLALPQDQAYVRETREKHFLGGRTLEEVQAGREDRLPLVPPELEPFRQLLCENPWIGGESPNYADYCTLSQFLWTAAVATTPPLPEDDPMRDWIERGFDLFDGLGRHPGMHTLFGLERRDGDPEPFVKGGKPLGVSPVNAGPASSRISEGRYLS
jgi:glutathione S-transferase